MLTDIAIPFTTNGAGAATVYGAALYSGGLVHMTREVDGGTPPTGGTATITDETTGAAIDVIILGGGNITHLPRAATVDQASGAALYAAGGTAVRDRAVLSGNGRVKVVVAGAGATKGGTIHVVVES